MLKPKYYGIDQYHACWCPAFFCQQEIRNHGIYHVGWTILVCPEEGFQLHVQFPWREMTKCKHFHNQIKHDARSWGSAWKDCLSWTTMLAIAEVGQLNPMTTLHVIYCLTPLGCLVSKMTITQYGEESIYDPRICCKYKQQYRCVLKHWNARLCLVFILNKHQNLTRESFQRVKIFWINSAFAPHSQNLFCKLHVHMNICWDGFIGRLWPCENN